MEAGLISYSANTIITNNKVSDLKWRQSGAFHIYRSHNIQLLNNDIEASSKGIMLIASTENQIKGNRIADAPFGIAFFESSNNNVVENNTLSKNVINVFFSASKDNTFHSNNLLVKKNQVQTFDDSVNMWSDNYWDDYLGADDNNDNTGDTPYLVKSIPLDKAPKMKPNSEIAYQVSQLMPTQSIKPPKPKQNIMTDVVWENQVIQLQSNLVVYAKLTIKNSELIASPTGTESRIEVKKGGLYIYNSLLKGDGINSYFSIWVNEGSSLVIKDSKIYYAGDWGGNGGIEIFGDGAIIENNELLGSYVGIDIRDSSNHRIVGNTILNSVDAIAINGVSVNNVIENNKIPSYVDQIINQVFKPYVPPDQMIKKAK